MRYWLATLAVMLTSAAMAEEPLLLRCVANDELNRANGRYLMVYVDHDQRLIRTRDYYVEGEATREYHVVRSDGDTVEGANDGPQGRQKIVLDRVSGRLTAADDGSAHVEELWNPKKQRLGGFDLKPGEPLWVTVTFECAPSARRF